jgi:hypothetical protein
MKVYFALVTENTKTGFKFCFTSEHELNKEYTFFFSFQLISDLYNNIIDSSLC